MSESQNIGYPADGFHLPDMPKASALKSKLSHLVLYNLFFVLQRPL